MTQWILTGSLLILAVLLIRVIGRDRLSARVRYALWALVLVRLLMPFSVGESILSVQNLMQETEYAEVQTEPILISDIIETTQTSETIEIPMIPIAEGESSRTYIYTPVLIWALGSIITALIFIISNLRFAAQLRRSRQTVMQSSVPVYVTEAVETPCLFGLWKPAIYVTPEVWENETALRHVLAHELTHYRHKDHIWSVLRCVCVCVHWFNPLVWVAAVLSQKDAEMACDEGTLLHLGEQERTGYAKTLVDLTCVGYKGMLTAATSMTGSESDLKQRVLRIVKNPKMSAIAVVIVLVAAILVSLTVFTAAKAPAIEGVWRMELTHLGVGVEEPESAYMEYEFYEGRGIRTDHMGGELRSAEWFSYTVDGDALELWFDSAEAAEPYLFAVTDDTLTLRQDKRELNMTRVEREEKPYLPNTLSGIYSLQLSRPNEEYMAELTVTEQAQLMALLHGGTVLGEVRQVASNDAYMYAADVSGKNHSMRLAISNGLVYNANREIGYAVSNIEEIVAWLEAREWQTLTMRNINGVVIDNAPVADAVNITWGKPRYNYTVPTDQAAWRAAVDAARAAGVPDNSKMELFEYMTFGLYVDNEHWYFDTKGTAFIAGSELYITPEYTDTIMRLMQPYVDLVFPHIGATLPYAGTTHYIAWETNKGTTIKFVDEGAMQYLGDMLLMGAGEVSYNDNSVTYIDGCYKLFSSAMGIDGDDILVTDQKELVIDMDQHYALSNGAEVLQLLEQLMNASDTKTIVTSGGEPVQVSDFEPSDLRGIVSAELILYDRVFPADLGQLAFLEELLTTAEPLGYTSGCPFNGLIAVTLSDGRKLGVEPALDSCAAFMIWDTCYEYGNQFATDDEGSYDNSALLAVFGLTSASLEEFITSNIPSKEGEVLGTNADIGDVVREQNDVMEPTYLSDEAREAVIVLLAQGIGEAIEGEFVYDTTYYTIFSSGQDTEDGFVLLSDNGSLSMDGVVYELSTGQELLRLLDAFYHQIRITVGGYPVTDLTGVIGEFLYPELGGVPENAEILWSSDDEAVCTVTGDAYGAEIYITGVGEAAVIAEYTENGNRYGYSVRVCGKEP